MVAEWCPGTETLFVLLTFSQNPVSRGFDIWETGVGGPGVARLRSNHHRSTWLPLRRLPGSGGVVA